MVMGRVLQNGQENSTYGGLCLCYCRATGREGERRERGETDEERMQRERMRRVWRG